MFIQSLHVSGWDVFCFAQPMPDITLANLTSYETVLKARDQPMIYQLSPDPHSNPELNFISILISPDVHSRTWAGGNITQARYCGRTPQSRRPSRSALSDRRAEIKREARPPGTDSGTRPLRIPLIVPGGEMPKT